MSLQLVLCPHSSMLQRYLQAICTSFQEILQRSSALRGLPSPAIADNMSTLHSSICDQKSSPIHVLSKIVSFRHVRHLLPHNAHKSLKVICQCSCHPSFPQDTLQYLDASVADDLRALLSKSILESHYS
eukprot:NODE_395_length_9429_cov_0.550054.p5 type:complete len:129 gc:universal NODE_395_length_9429_cov_0.550054:3903-4289(+)